MSASDQTVIDRLAAIITELEEQGKAGYWRQCYETANASVIALRKENGELAADVVLQKRCQDALEVTVAQLREALKSLIKTAPRIIECNNMHHPKQYLHNEAESCEMVGVYYEALEDAAKIALDVPNNSDPYRNVDSGLYGEEYTGQHKITDDHEYCQHVHGGGPR